MALNGAPNERFSSLEQPDIIRILPAARNPIQRLGVRDLPLSIQQDSERIHLCVNSQ